MDYKKLYASKLCTAKEAVKDVTSGDWVDYGWCTGHPVALDKALAERMPELEDVKIRGGIALWRPAILILRTRQIIFAGIPGICPESNVRQ